MIVYIFLDEGGNFDFSTSGSCYYTFTSVVMVRPFTFYSEFENYKYDVIEYGKNLDKFHCAEDNAHVRGRVFGLIKDNLDKFRIDSVVVRKCKTGPALRPPEKFYPRMLSYLLKHIIDKFNFDKVEEVIVITDSLPTKRNKRLFEKSIKKNLNESLRKDACYRIIHHPSSAHYGLQIADYCNWAIMRKWERGDAEHYSTIRNAIKSEFNIFRSGTTKYYDDGRPVKD